MFLFLETGPFASFHEMKWYISLLNLRFESIWILQISSSGCCYIMSMFALVMSFCSSLFVFVCSCVGFRHDVHVSLMDPLFEALFIASKRFCNAVSKWFVLRIHWTTESNKYTNTKRLYESEVPFLTLFLISYCRIIYYLQQRKGNKRWFTVQMRLAHCSCFWAIFRKCNWLACFCSIFAITSMLYNMF